jgi:phenol 2-monooxygenase (NADPH)
MNVSMHDSFNLAWKLNLVLRNIALPSLLETYECERRQVAQQLINFDFEHANAFSAGDAAALAENFDKNIRFISGIGIKYKQNVLNMPQRDVSYKFPGGDLVSGTLLPCARVTRYVDANPVDIQLDIPLLAQFRVYFFVSDIHVFKPSLQSICDYIGSEKSVLGRASKRADKSYQEWRVKETEADEYLQPGRYTSASKLFTPAIMTTMKKERVEIKDLPSLLRDSPWTFYLDDVGLSPGICTEKWLGGLHDGEFAIVNVRPDGYVGSIGRFEVGEEHIAKEWFDEYYRGFLNDSSQ